MPRRRQDQKSGKQEQSIADARILGQILAAQNILSVLPNTTRITEFCAQALADVPGASSCCVLLGSISVRIGEMDADACAECERQRRSIGEAITVPAAFKCRLAEKPDRHAIAIETTEHHFGFFVFRTNKSGGLEPYIPFLSNLANYVALSLETRLQRDQLQEAHDELERKVEKRTEELKTLNENLQEEIADRKRAEEQAKQLQEYHQMQIDRMPIGLIVWDKDFRVKEWNPAATSIFGFTKEESLGKHPYDLIVPQEVQPAVDEIWDRLLNGDLTAHSVNENRTRDGRTIICDWTNTPLKGVDGTTTSVLSMVQDITDRKRTERLALEQFELAETFFNQSITCLVILDRNYNFIRVNEAYARACHRDISDFVGRNHFEMYPSDAKQIFDEVVRTKRPFQTFSRPFAFPDQPERGVTYWDWTLVPILNAQGEVDYLVLSLNEVTARKRAEEALREREERYRHLFEEDLAGHYVSTPGGRLLECNPAFARMFGFASIEEAKSRNMVSLYPTPEGRAEFLDKLKRQRRLEHHEGALRRKDGAVVHVIENAIPTFNPSGEIVEIHGFLLDQTERLKAEEQLRQTQKMDAVGRLAGGIAHDFNNILGVIIGYSELLSNRVGPDDPMHKQLQEIYKAGNRGASLTRQMLAFSRKQVMQPTVLNLNAVVEDTDKMLRRLIGEDIELLTLLEPTLGSVRADPSQLEQIILNLAVNSRDAMPKGGKLTIETANVELGEDFTRLHPGLGPGHYVMLAVSDTGIGMDKETQSHIYEPFFTTKEPGKGTGMGLATVYGIVKQSNGYIAVYSEIGQGTVFKIYLPRVEGSTAPEERGKVATEVPYGTETVLLVEDADPLRKLIREILESCGYAVLETGDPWKAIQIEKEHGEKISLLLTDVVMPGMSGRILAETLKSARPELSVLYISGYTDDAILHHGVLEPGIVFLQKPFTRDALARKVREVLDASKK